MTRGRFQKLFCTLRPTFEKLFRGVEHKWTESYLYDLRRAPRLIKLTPGHKKVSRPFIVIHGHFCIIGGGVRSFFVTYLGKPPFPLLPPYKALISATNFTCLHLAVSPPERTPVTFPFSSKTISSMGLSNMYVPP